MCRMKFTSPRALLRIERILALLEKEPLTVHQIAERLYSTNSATNKYIVHLHAAPKRIYIAGWDTSGFRPVALFAKGAATDTPKPPPKSTAQIWQETKSDPAKLARRLADQKKVRERQRNGRPLKRVRAYDPPLAQQVQELIEAWPGLRSEQIAAKLDASQRTTTRALAQLRKQGLATCRRRAHFILWESAARQVVRHAPVVAKRQSVFAALGV